MKKLLVILMVLAGISIAGTFPVEKDTALSLSIVTTGDTAKVLQFTPTAADSFTYHDSLRVQADTSVFDTVGWCSPVQSMILTPGVTVDTTIAYACSLVFAAPNTLGISYACIEDTSLLLLVDSLVANINAEAALTDSVVAQDSGTYVKIVSLFSQATFTARWSMILADSLDTASQVTTVAMVCDSMVAAVNGRDTMSAYVTAANVGDSVYTLTALDPGLYFFGVNTDANQDTSTLTANAMSRSILNDTIPLAPSVTNSQNFTGAYITVILDSSITTTNQGIGLSDSCYLRILARRDIGKNVEYFSVYRDSAAGLPCTLRVSRTAADAGGDTLFKELLYLNYLITDTASDTTVTMKHQLHIDGRLYEQ